MKKVAVGIMSVIAAWLLLLAMLLSGVFVCTTSRAFYRYEYQKYGQAQNIGIDEEGLMRITNALLDYLWGTRETLDMQAEINGEIREVFTQREKNHMVDVRNLIHLSRIALALSLLCGIVLWISALKIGKTLRNGARISGTFYLIGELLLVIAVGIVTVLALKNFNAVFIKFHQIFFTNDLWLLNADDMLILMVPEAFFEDCAALIAILFGCGVLATSIIALSLVFRKGQNEKNQSGWKLAAVDGEDGDSFYRIMETDSGRREDLNTSEIFERLGLSDEENGEETDIEEEDEPDEETEPVEWLKTVQTSEDRPSDPPKDVEKNCLRLDAPNQSEREMRIHLDMTMDLMVNREKDGRVSLVPDPDSKPKITLSTAQGNLSFEADTQSEGIALDEGAPTDEGTVAALEPVPSPEELLKQMDELMQGYPEQREEKKD